MYFRRARVAGRTFAASHVSTLATPPTSAAQNLAPTFSDFGNFVFSTEFQKAERVWTTVPGAATSHHHQNAEIFHEPSSDFG
jgi:hypothetical protein